MTHRPPGAIRPPARRVAAKPRVIVTRKLLPATAARMAELFDARFNADDRALTRDEFAAAMADCDVLVPTVTDRIDAGLIAGAGDRLGLIANFGAGIEHIDLHAARARKIIVTNTPGVFTDDTADMTMALILSVPRRFVEGGRILRAGDWQGWAPVDAARSPDRRQKRWESSGWSDRPGGRRRARGFGLSVAYHNRHRLPEEVGARLAARFEPILDR